MILRIISLAFLFYILYKFVFGFVLPVFQATRKIRKGFRDMQQNAQDNARHAGRQQTASSNPTSSAGPGGEKKKSPAGDYIDFEEIK